MNATANELDAVRAQALNALHRAMRREATDPEAATTAERLRSFDEQRARDIAFTYIVALRVRLARSRR